MAERYAKIKKNYIENPRGRNRIRPWKKELEDTLKKRGRWETPEMKRKRKMEAAGYFNKSDLPYEIVSEEFGRKHAEEWAAQKEGPFKIRVVLKNATKWKVPNTFRQFTNLLVKDPDMHKMQ